MMIKIYYYSEADESTKKVLCFLEERKIQVQKIKMQKITRKELIHILSLSENGFTSIIRRVQDTQLKNKIKTIDSSTAQLINFLLAHKHFIKSPILVDEHRLQVGYHIDEIRQFIPRGQRNSQIKRIIQKEELSYGMG